MNRCILALLLLLSMAGVSLPEGPVSGLAWDALFKESFAKKGETNVVVTFRFTNTTSSEIVLTAAKPSCHCTVIKDFAFPKKIAPGESGQLKVEVDILVKTGALNKTIAVETSAATNLLSLTVHLPTLDQREKNRVAAFVDRQAVFKLECAQCHAAPTVAKKGEPLYQAACAICHDSEHRADMVPDLAALKTPANENYWAQWITIGKPGTFMPGFHKRSGGPLTDEQISSLVAFLGERFSKRKTIPGKAVLPLD